MKFPRSLASCLLLGSLQAWAFSATPFYAPPTGASLERSPQSPDDPGAVRTGVLAVVPVAEVTEVPVEKNAPPVEGHPLTSVVVTQCNLIVAVYMTMPDGRLLRFDHTATLKADQLMTLAYSATRSERVEVSCNDSGAQGYEKHEPV